MSELPEIDEYLEFAMSLPEEQRRSIGKLLEDLVTHDGGGWTIAHQSADEFLDRHRSYLKTIIESDHYDAFHADD